MTEATDTPGVLTGKDRSPVLPILVLLISAGLGALTSWTYRVLCGAEDYAETGGWKCRSLQLFLARTSRSTNGNWDRGVL